MKINVIDGSNYFKGLLLLIRKDKKITEEEVTLMKMIGRKLGFETEFCNNAIRDILDNQYIVDEPPIFSSKELAYRFIKDGIKLALSDARLHPFEEQWLRHTAEKNGIDPGILSDELKKVLDRNFNSGGLEIDDISIEF